MAKLYKLTDEKGQTFNNTQWGEGVVHEATGTGDLCTSGWIHAYTSPLLAVLLNPIHANFSNPKLWECEGEVGKEDNGLKVGCKGIRVIREIALPKVSTIQKQPFAILVVKEVYKGEEWNKWADKWVSGEDRSIEAAEAAARAAAWAAEAAGADNLDLISIANKAMEVV